MRAGLLRNMVTGLLAWRAAWSFPPKYRLLFATNPLDATRYQEFSWLLAFLRENGVKGGRVLDVSSPVMLSYLLTRLGYEVTKTDIDPREGRFLAGLAEPVFEVQDARDLQYPDGSFDLTVSISVIEHIHREYDKAVLEMIRVTRPGGYVCVTFPVAGSHREEWSDERVYTAQKRIGDKVFFQYRFGPSQYEALKNLVEDSAEMVVQEIYWERRPGRYDRLVGRLRRQAGGAAFRHLRASVLNVVTGPGFFDPRPGTFEKGRPFGNAHWVLRVRGGAGER